MEDPILLSRVERDADGSLRVLAPCVGWWSDLPHPGALLGAGSRIGYLFQLNRRCRLLLPEGAAGRVSGGLPHRRSAAVEYGQLLFRLSPVEAGGVAESLEEPGTLGHPAGVDLPTGARAVVAPTDGVFYRSPSPDAPPFVETGQRIQLGQAVGLVEVMKTFNQILYEGPGFAEQAEVLEVRAADAQEVRAGDVLVVVR